MRRSSLPELEVDQVDALQPTDRYIYQLALAGETQAFIARKCNKSPGFVAYRIQRLRDANPDSEDFDVCAKCHLRMVVLVRGRLVRGTDHACMEERALQAARSGISPLGYAVDGHQLATTFRRDGKAMT